MVLLVHTEFAVDVIESDERKARVDGVGQRALRLLRGGEGLRT